MAERINRIRLEFKGLTDIQSGTRCIVLIESDWNLKQINEEWANRHMSINRIRLEFKEHHRCTEAVTQFLY